MEISSAKDKFWKDIAKRNAYARKWRALNADRINSKMRERRRNDPYFGEKLRAKDRARYPHRLDQRYKKLGISLSDYNEFCALQNNACAICGRNDQKLMVDHCHKKGSFRSLLCRSCNSLLGWYERYQSKIDAVLSK